MRYSGAIIKLIFTLIGKVNPFPPADAFDAIAADDFWKHYGQRWKLLIDEQFHLWPKNFQLYLTIKLSFIEIFHVFVNKFWKSSSAELLYVAKAYCLQKEVKWQHKQTVLIKLFICSKDKQHSAKTNYQGICNQYRFRSASASTQSDLAVHWSPIGCKKFQKFM